MNMRCPGLLLCSAQAGALLAMTALAPAAGPDQQSWVDRDLFPEAYGILTSDRVMFPDNVTDWPLKIDATHQLFIDDCVMSEIEGLTREFHQPVKHPKNPLMPGGYLAVLYDSDKNQFRMWNNVEYFTSRDGLEWEQLSVDAEAKMKGELRGFLYNPDVPEAEGRYKAVVERRFTTEEEEPGGFYLYHSRDGLRWEQRPRQPILQRTVNCMLPSEFRPAGIGEPGQLQYSNPERFQSYGVGDTSTFRYDTVLKRYIFDGKFNLVMPEAKIKELGINTENKPRLKLRTFSESEDLVHWSPPRFILYPDRLDPIDRQMYCHVGFVYESMWLGLLQSMACSIGWKQTDLQLTYSRDGYHWLRPQDRTPFIPLGDDKSWEADYHVSTYTAPVLVGDELFIYYTSSRNADRGPGEKWAQHVGLAKLRRDGFASLNAGEKPGRVVTRPLSFKGRNLFVNAEVGDGGWVRAAVLTRDSKPVQGYGLGESVGMDKGATRGRVMWKSRDQLEPPGEDHLRIVFQLRNAKLYSFWIQ